MTLPRGWDARLAAWLGGPTRRRIARWSLQVRHIEAWDTELRQQTDAGLRKRSLSLRYRWKSHEPPSRLLAEAFATVREAARRTLSMRHYDVQLLAGLALRERSVVEMQTGEGKTLTATLPLYLFALAGKGAHLITANDYLAKRDADQVRPMFELLGMTVGVIQQSAQRDDRRRAYACDVTYATASELGFDFLRDRLLLRSQGSGAAALFAPGLGEIVERPVGREPYFALIDEADSVLIDEARTPLVISAPPNESQQREAACYVWAASVAERFREDQEYTYDHERKLVELNAAGRRLVRSLPKPAALAPVTLVDLYRYAERAVHVEKQFRRDRDFVIRDGEVVIVDEFTGRLAEGRKWRDGIHQAVEAMAGVQVTFSTDQAARITVQDLFLRYPHLAGMTGTAANSGAEFRNVYRTRVVPIPTHRPPQRKRLPDRVFGDTDAKWRAIVAEVAEVHATGRPVLIGTRSIDKSDVLSALLTQAGIPHEVLNARQIAREAEIIAAAGEQGRVTVSTNMAGRGTDIQLGPQVAGLGGLHVICTELHDSPRIDRQLIGRCGRQGDPGSYRQFLALDDEILGLGLGPDSARALAAIGQKNSSGLERFAPLFRKAQRRIERRHYRQRRMLLVHERERKRLHESLGQDPFLDSPS